ncbi:MAG: hypothetical protein DMG98_15860 [Acidobacteria bacterium]|nr:MAG: hypothetical protein DMG98_15860 [Acidobacteriota bacterium]
MYAYGQGVSRDRIGALRWYRMAAEQGNPDAKRFLSSLKPPIRTRYFELGTAVIEGVGGLLLFLPSLISIFQRRRLGEWRQAAVTALRFECIDKRGIKFLRVRS